MKYRDQLFREIHIDGIPKRIISLVPSQTELLVDLGLEKSLVGVTKFCVHPVGLRKQKTIVGGTKSLKYDLIDELNPDIILCNKEENTKEIVENLSQKYPVHVSDISTIAESLQLILQYGEIFDMKNQAEQIVEKVRIEEKRFVNFISEKPQKKVAYFIWRDPWMAVGGGTFINEMLKLNGFINVYQDVSRYPEISKDDLRDLIENLDVILLSSEPFPFSEKHIEEIKVINPKANVQLVDGEYFSWYGSRLVNAFTYFKTLH